MSAGGITLNQKQDCTLTFKVHLHVTSQSPCPSKFDIMLMVNGTLVDRMGVQSILPTKDTVTIDKMLKIDPGFRVH